MAFLIFTYHLFLEENGNMQYILKRDNKNNIYLEEISLLRSVLFLVINANMSIYIDNNGECETDFSMDAEFTHAIEY